MTRDPFERREEKREGERAQSVGKRRAEEERLHSASHALVLLFVLSSPLTSLLSLLELLPLATAGDDYRNSQLQPQPVTVLTR